MADPRQSDPWLPEDLELRVMEILELSDDEVEAALEQLYRAHPGHAPRIRKRLAHAHELRGHVDSSLAGDSSEADATGNNGDDQLLDRLGDDGPPQIEGYQVLGVLGRGGMGTVYLAEQSDPLPRRVALKVIRRGMDSEGVLRRFELERQTLALMSHANIARVFDAGTTERGRPYFAMEHVPGPPLSEYCDTDQLSLERRIRLFVEVCEGVQYAHQKGVIHRDLKPSNVLVTEESGEPVPKIIDFGLVRATDAADLGGSLQTLHGHVVGTPEYMSPEQADPTVADIDTRTDIYSLGVMLYELLVGTLPFEEQELRGAGIVEMQRLIREVEPPRPSSKLSSHDGASVRAGNRRTSIHALQRILRTDLDWVVLRAMHKDRELRYESAGALAADLTRYLDHEPLEAGPPSAAYRLRKFVRRYRARVTAAAAVFLTAVVGAAVSIGYAVEASANARESERNEREAVTAGEQAEAKAAEAQARKAEFDLLANLLRLEEAEVAETELYPAWPEQVGAMRQWLKQHANPLRDGMEGLRKAVAQLERRALPWTEADRESDGRSHSRFPELESARARLATTWRALAVREGRESLAELEFPDELRDRSPGQLNRIVWQWIGQYENNRGKERFALVVARRAYQLAEGKEKAAAARNLAWAQMLCGLDAEAPVTMASAVELATVPATKREYEAQLKTLRRFVGDRAGDGLARVAERIEQRIAALELEVEQRLTWRFDTDAERFLHRALREVLGKIDAFEEKRASVEQRLAWAERIEQLTQTHPNARVSWAQAREAILKADGVVASSLYRRHAIDLRPQTGLVPIGMNPATQLWEFYHLRSAWDPKSGVDPAALEIPRHEADGSFEVTEETGIVFVLIPGGTFWMGAQAEDPEGHNYDRSATVVESPVHDVSLDPFFMARHETTQGQWLSLSGAANPSGYPAAPQVIAGMDVPIDLRHPVESVSKEECQRLLRSHGLALPTEAQWEYGCRAGAEWSPGSELADLERLANVMDQRAANRTNWLAEPVSWDDGFIIHAPVDALPANPFGLHSMRGNVNEWCRDAFGLYGNPVAVDSGLRLLVTNDPRRTWITCRGGSFKSGTETVRIAHRSRGPTDGPRDDRGARAVRVLVR